MLEKVTIANFGPIKEEITFSMIKGKTEQFPQNIVPNSNLLKTALIYGANNSGKSGFISAFKMLKELFLEGKSVYGKGYLPNLITNDAISVFEFEFKLKNKKINYLLSIDFPRKLISDEYLSVDEKIILHREGNKAIRDIDLKNITEKIKNDKNLVVDKLFIDKLFNEDFSKNGLEIDKSISYLSYHYNKIGDNEIINTLYKYVENIFFLDQQRRNEIDSFYGRFDDSLINYVEENTKQINCLLKNFGFNFEIEVKENENSIEKGKNIHILKEELSHLSNSPRIEITESFGTVVFLKLLISALAQKEKSFLMIIDEIERGLHASLIANFIKFINRELPNVQLILPTHMTDLLNTDLDIRKDQIYITEIKNGNFSIKRNFNKRHIRETMNFQKLLKSNAVGGIPNISIDREEKC